MPKRQRGLFELYQDDPERADALVWGRRVDPRSRRGFLRGLGLASMGTALGAVVPFHRSLPGGVIPAAWAESPDDFVIEGKDGLVLLNDRPLNAETPVTLLDDPFTPNHRHFVRNNGRVSPRAEAGSLEGWTLTVDGEVRQALTLDFAALTSGDFEVVERAVVLECGGNGRAGFNPPAKGNQWTLGAVGCAVYKGVRLRDVLKRAGVKESAVYVGYYGEDLHLSGDPDKPVISRGCPIDKALHPETLLAFEMNGAPLPALHGFPVRLVVPGFPASASGKWLRRLWVRDRVHDGAKMGAPAYRVPRFPVAPGAEVAKADMAIIETMPVKSIITTPKTGVMLADGEALSLRGHAWAGSGAVAAVHLSVDFGTTWQPMGLGSPRNAWAWQRWQGQVRFPTRGYYEVWARATDAEGRSQPMVLPGWNPKGYLNNAMQRIAVTVA